jgi:hypothetical protein
MKRFVEAVLIVFTAVAASAQRRYQFPTMTAPGSVPCTTIPTGINNENVIFHNTSNGQFTPITGPAAAKLDVTPTE